jgi:DICT domain-containing protein
MQQRVRNFATDCNLVPVTSEEYTAAELADLTGVPPGTLRVWVSRYGFPAPLRHDNTRKRYDRNHVEQVLAVLEYRRRGLSLPAAIERAQSGARSAPRSLFAALRSARPDLPVRVLSKRLLMALSRAIEDEHAARDSGGLLLGSFQHERHYRASERRWRELARSAEMTIVLADFATLRRDPAGPIEVPLERSHPLEREWTVVLYSATASACLAAWEVPEPRPIPDGDRRFEMLWSCDPSAVHSAISAAAGVLAPSAPEVAQALTDALQRPIASQQDLRFNDDLTSRAFSYLAATAESGR